MKLHNRISRFAILWELLDENQAQSPMLPPTPPLASSPPPVAGFMVVPMVCVPGFVTLSPWQMQLYRHAIEAAQQAQHGREAC